VPLMGEAGSTYNTMWAGLEACLCTKWHVDPSSRLAGPKIGGSAPWGNWVRIKHNVARAETYLRTKWHLDPFNHLATMNVDRKGGEG